METSNIISAQDYELEVRLYEIAEQQAQLSPEGKRRAELEREANHILFELNTRVIEENGPIQ